MAKPDPIAKAKCDRCGSTVSVFENKAKLPYYNCQDCRWHARAYSLKQATTWKRDLGIHGETTDQKTPEDSGEIAAKSPRISGFTTLLSKGD